MLLLLGVLVYVGLFVAMLLLSRNADRVGWVVYAVDAVLWIIYGCLLAQWVWIPFNLALLFIALNGLKRTVRA